jgi:hypothetical protein
LKLRKSKKEAKRKVPSNLALSYYKRLALVLGFWIPLSLLGYLLSFLANLRGTGFSFWFSFVPWILGFSWLGYAIYVFIWAFTKVNALVVLVIDRDTKQAGIGKKIAFTQFFALAGLMLGIASFLVLFTGPLGWNFSSTLALLTIVSQVLSFRHVPLFSQLLSDDKIVALEGDQLNSKESQLSNE